MGMPQVICGDILPDTCESKIKKRFYERKYGLQLLYIIGNFL